MNTTILDVRSIEKDFESVKAVDKLSFAIELNRSKTSKTVILRLNGQPVPEAIKGFAEIEKVEALRDGEVAFALKRGISINDFLLKVSAKLAILDIRSKDPTLHEVFIQSIQNQGDLPEEGA